MGKISSSTEIDLEFLRQCLKEAGAIALGQRGQMTAAVKADNTPVTEVDRQVEEFLIGRISDRYPAHAILSEETGQHLGAEGKQASVTWVIDPIDGTRSFASGLPIWGVSIGILRDGEPVAGGLYLPVSDEMYWGSTAQAYYNQHPLPPIQSVDPENVLVFLAVPSDFHLHFKIRYPRVRSLGSTAAHLAYAATGAAAGVLLGKIGLWDIAGLLPILSAVGIQITHLDGRLFQPASMLNGKTVQEPLLVAHPSVMEALRREIILE